MKMTSIIEEYIKKHTDALACVTETLSPMILLCNELLEKAISDKRKILIMGNGGSAADAQHFAAELVGRFRRERKAFPAIALTTDTSALTAIGNDYGFESIFSRQVEALASPGDVVIGLSTSGNSINVIKAMKSARAAGCKTVGLLGRDGGSLAESVDLALVVPAEETSHIQECHIVLIHLLCELVEQALERQ
jgi:D-sedoheptulose 7-phosphate isomerase